MEHLAVAHNSICCDAVPSERDFITSRTCWYVIHVRSRHEFVVYADLLGKGMEAFLPSVKKYSQWKDRRKLIEYPLFPGYVFVRVPVYPGAFLAVLKTRGVAAFVCLEPGAPTPVVPEEIESLKLMIESGRSLDVYPHLKEGERVRLKNGPLKNAEGILTKKENEYLFSVNVELLGRSIAVKVAAHDLETV